MDETDPVQQLANIEARKASFNRSPFWFTVWDIIITIIKLIFWICFWAIVAQCSCNCVWKP